MVFCGAQLVRRWQDKPRQEGRWSWRRPVNELRLADPQARQRQVQGPGYIAQVHYSDKKVVKKL